MRTLFVGVLALQLVLRRFAELALASVAPEVRPILRKLRRTCSESRRASSERSEALLSLVVLVVFPCLYRKLKMLRMLRMLRNIFLHFFCCFESFSYFCNQYWLIVVTLRCYGRDYEPQWRCRYEILLENY